MAKDKYFFLFFISQLNISGHQCCFLYMTELVAYPQMMDCICTTALPMDSSSSAWEMRNNNHPRTSYSQVFVYLKGKCPSSDGGWERKGRKSYKMNSSVTKANI